MTLCGRISTLIYILKKANVHQNFTHQTPIGSSYLSMVEISYLEGMLGHIMSNPLFWFIVKINEKCNGIRVFSTVKASALSSPRIVPSVITV